MARFIPPEHPGVILKEEFLDPLGLSNYALAKSTGISQTAVGEIVRGSRSISITNGLRLAKFFGLSEKYFIELQTQYEVDLAKQKEGSKLNKIIKFVPKGNKTPDQEEPLEA